VSFLRAFGAPWLLLWRTLGAVRQAGVSFRASVAQAYELGNRSVWLIGFGMAFFGAVMVTIADTEARRVTGNLTVVGPAYFELLVREFGPIITALLAAARIGAGASAELSWMTVGEQVEALQMSAADPLAELVAPRVLGGLFALPVLCALGTVCASGAAVATATWGFHVDGSAFIDARYLGAPDLLCAFLKAAACGLYIPLVASWRGLTAQGGASAVGTATTNGVVGAVFGCLAIDFVVDEAFLILRA
jgi:phospholipid/cholesterol/gamma-HCH transport system permease protein